MPGTVADTLKQKGKLAEEYTIYSVNGEVVRNKTKAEVNQLFKRSSNVDMEVLGCPEFGLGFDTVR